jgi:hypothetical protein
VAAQEESSEKVSSARKLMAAADHSQQQERATSRAMLAGWLPVLSFQGQKHAHSLMAYVHA